MIYAQCQAVNNDLLVVMNGHSVCACLLQQKHRFRFLSLALKKKGGGGGLSGTRELMFVYDEKLQTR